MSKQGGPRESCEVDGGGGDLGQGAQAQQRVVRVGAHGAHEIRQGTETGPANAKRVSLKKKEGLGVSNVGNLLGDCRGPGFVCSKGQIASRNAALAP